MTRVLGQHDVERFRVAIARIFGLDFDESKSEFLAEVLSRRADTIRAPAGLYVTRLEEQHLPSEVRALASELTVGETYFFRNIEQFRAVAEVVLPERVAARAGARVLRLLSAGCASGEEPYSLALLLRERGIDPAWNVSIRGIDVNPVMLDRAAKGRYSPWALRETPKEIQQRWFRAQGRDFLLSDTVRSNMTFIEQNLLDDDAQLWAAGTYDVVFCRNVIMYLTPDCAARVIDKITRALAPGGYLFLGHAETLRGLSSEYHLRHTHGTFYYQRRDAPPRPLDDTLSAGRHANNLPELAQELTYASSWVDAVQHASDRIRALAEPPVASSGDRGAAAPSNATRSAVDLSVALELLKRERFADALDLLNALPTESRGDADVLLLRAALLAHSGQLEAAERVCHELLQMDELSTGAHYLLALCREALGDRAAASDHDQVAVYLDPGFAMPRLHLGLMAGRAGDRDGARRELAQALPLLQREDPTRLLLFGGGFGREALVALCRAQLVAAGGRP